MSRTKYLSISIRVCLNFLTEYDIATDEDMLHSRKIHKSRRSNSDNFVPTDEQVKSAFDKTRNGRHKTIFLLLAYSGIRITEAVKMLREFDKDKLIVNCDIAKYPLSYNRGHKRVSTFPNILIKFLQQLGQSKIMSIILNKMG